MEIARQRREAATEEFCTTLNMRLDSFESGAAEVSVRATTPISVEAQLQIDDLRRQMARARLPEETQPLGRRWQFTGLNILSGSKDKCTSALPAAGPSNGPNDWFR